MLKRDVNEPLRKVSLAQEQHTALQAAYLKGRGISNGHIRRGYGSRPYILWAKQGLFGPISKDSDAVRRSRDEKKGAAMFISEHENHSEIACLRQRITNECLAAQRGLTGLASGTAMHQFITARLERMGASHQVL